MVTIVGVAKSIVWEQLYSCVPSFVTTFHTQKYYQWPYRDRAQRICNGSRCSCSTRLNQTFNYVNLTNHKIVQSGHLGRSKWPYYHNSSREMWYLYFMKCSYNLDMIIICSSTLVSILDNYTCQVSGVIAYGSKTSILHLLTPVFQFLMPGRNVWAITALTDTFWKH